MKNILLFAVFSWCAPVTVFAVTLTTIPMQGTMVMPMLAYHATEGTLSIQIDPAVPQLTPLLVSNPADSFDAVDPWFEALDPSRQGMAFSRRFGFVMDAGTDALPPGTSIWIRKLSSSPGLEAYRYRSGSARLWEPIFGTAGSTNALAWDGTMFHPVFAAVPGNGTHTAQFEAFLLDSSTGLPVPGANTGVFSFHWTVVSDGRPTLAIHPGVAVSWPASASNYVLEAAITLPASEWSPVTNTPVLHDGQWSVTLESGASSRYFRMRLLR